MNKVILTTTLLLLTYGMSSTAFAESGDHESGYHYVIVNGHKLTYRQITSSEFRKCGYLPQGNYIINIHTGAWSYASDGRPRGYMSKRCRNLFTTNYRRNRYRTSHEHYYQYHTKHHHHRRQQHDNRPTHQNSGRHNGYSENNNNRQANTHQQNKQSLNEKRKNVILNFVGDAATFKGNKKDRKKLNKHYVNKFLSPDAE